MTLPAENRLSTWLSRCKLKAKKSPAVLLKCFRLVKGQSTLLFESEANLAESEAADLAPPLLAQLEEDAGVIGGKGAYFVTCTRRGELEHFESVSLAITAPAGLVSQGFDEGATPALSSPVAAQAAVSLQQSNALVATCNMLIRHQETMFGKYIDATHKTFGVLEAEITGLRGRLNDLEAQRLNAIVTQESLLTMSAERELLRMKEQKEQDRKDQAISQFMPLLSMVMSKAAGIDTSEQSKTAFNNALVQFFESMSQQQFMAIMAQLTPEQQATMVLAWEEAQKVRDASKPKPQANGAANGAANDHGKPS